MKFPRPLALQAYYYGTLPYRKWVAHRAIIAGTVPISILFYHRVADVSPNDWTISNRDFERQIRWLQQHYDLISLGEVQERLRQRTSDRPAVSITFDDGYADNGQRALPLLIEAGIPCTYFVALHFVQHQQPFDHDVEIGQPLAPNTIEDLRSLARAGIEIGAHSRTHVSLGSIRDPARLHDEIVASRTELEQLLDCRVRYFAFPYGRLADISSAALSVAKEAGYAGVCSAYGGQNTCEGDGFHLRRIHGDPLMIRVKNWLTGDPRQQRRVHDLEQSADWSCFSAQQGVCPQ